MKGEETKPGEVLYTIENPSPLKEDSDDSKPDSINGEEEGDLIKMQ